MCMYVYIYVSRVLVLDCCRYRVFRCWDPHRWGSSRKGGKQVDDVISTGAYLDLTISGFSDWPPRFPFKGSRKGPVGPCKVHTRLHSEVGR